MKEKYNHDALNKKLEELSVPDEEQSWQKMKALLDKDEKKRRILPPFFLNCAGWGLLFLLTAGSIFIFRPFSKDNSVSKIDPIEKKNMRDNEISQQPEAKSSSENRRDTIVFSVPLKNKNYQNPGDEKYKSPLTKGNNRERNERTGSNPPMLSTQKKNGAAPVMNNSVNDVLTKSIKKNISEDNNILKKDSPPIKAIPSETNTVIKKDGGQVNESTSENNVAVQKDLSQINDSVSLETTDKDSLVAEKNLVQKKQKTQNFYLAAGLSLQQQIPINGQSLNAYSVNGGESLLADYLPAIYLRLYKENKWFLQAGFRYSAPQATKEILYNTRTSRDPVRRTVTRGTLTLKKTFYHQLPFSFNYSLLPNFSLGAGAMYSRFEGAVSEIELTVRNTQTNTETVTREIMKVPPNTDTVFSASQWHYLLQAEYSWKKWGVGFRYAGGLQPFIRYYDNGITKEEKNHSLQVFLRYDLVRGNQNNKKGSE